MRKARRQMYKVAEGKRSELRGIGDVEELLRQAVPKDLS